MKPRGPYDKRSSQNILNTGNWIFSQIFIPPQNAHKYDENRDVQVLERNTRNRLFAEGIVVYQRNFREFTEKYRVLRLYQTSLMAQMVKHLSTMQETRVWSLGREDPLEKEMAIRSSTIAWKIPWTEEPGRLQSMGSQRVGHDWANSLSLSRLYQDKHGKSTGFPTKGKSNFNIGNCLKFKNKTRNNPPLLKCCNFSRRKLLSVIKRNHLLT